MTRLTWLLACGLLAGCARPAVTGSAEASPPRAAAEPELPSRWAKQEDALSAHMQKLAAALTSVGQQVSTFERRGFLPAGMRKTFPLTVAAGRCLTLVTLTSPGMRDVDATLYTPEGEVLAEDTQPDSHPTIQVCGSETGPSRRYLTLHAYDGAGAYLLASFSGPLETLDEAARIVGGRPGVARELQARQPEQALMSELARSVRRRGFASTRAPFQVELRQGERVRFGLPVRGGRCYTVAGFASATLTRASLRVIDEQGRERVRDVAASRQPAVQLCAGHDADFAAELAAADGAGSALVVVYDAQAARIGGTGGLWLGTRSDALPARASLREALKRQSERAKATGGAEPRLVAEGHLHAGQAVLHAVRIAGATCTRLSAVGGRGIARIALYVRGEDGREQVGKVDRALAETELCPAQPADVEVLIVARSGQGDYALLTAPTAQAPPSR